MIKPFNKIIDCNLVCKLYCFVLCNCCCYGVRLLPQMTHARTHTQACHWKHLAHGKFALIFLFSKTPSQSISQTNATMPLFWLSFGFHRDFCGTAYFFYAAFNKHFIYFRSPIGCCNTWSAKQILVCSFKFDVPFNFDMYCWFFSLILCTLYNGIYTINTTNQCRQTYPTQHNHAPKNSIDDTFDEMFIYMCWANAFFSNLLSVSIDAIVQDVLA